MLQAPILSNYLRMEPYSQSPFVGPYQRDRSLENALFLDVSGAILDRHHSEQLSAPFHTIAHEYLPPRLIAFIRNELVQDEVLDNDSVQNVCLNLDHKANWRDADSGAWNITQSVQIHGVRDSVATQLVIFPQRDRNDVNNIFMSPIVQGFEYRVWLWERRTFMTIIQTYPLGGLYLKERLQIDLSHKRWKRDRGRMLFIERGDSHHAPSSPPSHQHLSLFSLNIQNVEYPWQSRFEKIIQTIQTLNPTIIALQEVRLDEEQELFSFHSVRDDTAPFGMPTVSMNRVHGRHQVQHFRDVLIQLGYRYHTSQSAMSYVTHPNPRAFPPRRNEEGLSIFSKYPIVDAQYKLLTRDYARPAQHQRIALSASVQYEGKRVNVYTTHLSLEESARNVQVRELYDWMIQEEEHDQVSLLCGDFNAEPLEPAVQFLASKLRDLHAEWRQSNPTSCSEYTFSTDFSRRKRIDYIMLRSNRREQVVDFRLVRSSVEDDSNTSLALSDHYAQYVRLRLRGE